MLQEYAVNDFYTFLLIGSLLLFVLLNSLFGEVFDKSFRLKTRKANGSLYLITFFLVAFIASIAKYIFTKGAFHKINYYFYPEKFQQIRYYLYPFGFILLFYIFNHFSLLMSNHFFSQKDYLSKEIKLRISIRIWFSIYLLFLSALSLYTQVLTNWLVYLFLGSLTLIKLYQFIKISVSLDKSHNTSPFYIFLYFCGLEILPSLVLFKLIYTW